MGRTYLFECAKCGYRAQVAGGAERGLLVAVQTIQCLECRELHDAVTEIKVPHLSAANLARWKLKFNSIPLDTVIAPAVPPSFPAALNRLVIGSGKRFCWVRYKAVCPVSPRHRIREWNQPGKCPKCGVFLEGNAIPFKVWD
jgi:hypothetical protein